jgi:beta-N-acetylhexosaminidase
MDKQTWLTVRGNKMAIESQQWIDQLLGKMTLEQKIGQMLILGFCGPVITPDIVELITKYHLGGLRISQKFRTMTIVNDVKPGTEPDENTRRSLHYPSGFNRDYAYISPPTSCTAREYALSLNRLRDYALDRALSIPLHFTIDQEGSACDDLLSSQRLFPHAMGYSVAKDRNLTYRSGLCIAKQARAIGANMIHSPVLDVNTNPLNPEIGTRAFSALTDEVVLYATEMMQGLKDGGLFTTGKHFPGRGESQADAHWGLPSVDISKEELYDLHIHPYTKLIEAGLDAVMLAHCCYPSLGESKKPACVSSIIIRDILRNELGFKGIITTDNMMMGGILQKYEMTEAVVKSVEAGCDLILCRDETPLRYKIIESLIAAVKNGRIDENRIDESVQRILSMRWRMGLAENGGKVDPALADEPFNDPFIVKTATEAAQKTVMVKDTMSQLPLDPNKRVLLIEQVFPTHSAAANMYSHPGLLWDEMCRLSHHVLSVEIPYVPRDMDLDRIRRRVGEAEVVVMTNYYYHKNAASISNFVRKVMSMGKKVIVVTNTPYEFGLPEDFPTGIVCFNPGGREHMKAVAQTIYGKLKAKLYSRTNTESLADGIIENK